MLVTELWAHAQCLIYRTTEQQRKLRSRSTWPADEDGSTQKAIFAQVYSTLLHFVAALVVFVCVRYPRLNESRTASCLKDASACFLGDQSDAAAGGPWSRFSCLPAGGSRCGQGVAGKDAPRHAPLFGWSRPTRWCRLKLSGSCVYGRMWLASGMPEESQSPCVDVLPQLRASRYVAG